MRTGNAIIFPFLSSLPASMVSSGMSRDCIWVSVLGKSMTDRVLARTPFPAATIPCLAKYLCGRARVVVTAHRRRPSIVVIRILDLIQFDERASKAQ